MKRTQFIAALFTASAMAFACKKSTDAQPDSTTTTTTTTTVTTPATAVVPDVFKKMYGATSVTSDGTFIYIKTTGVPDHKSAYFTTSSSLYESFSGTTYAGNTFNKAPGTLAAQNYVFKIPANPQVATNHQATALGPIGVALNGVPFFNQYNGQNQPVTAEIVSFDQWWGHPSPMSEYHYHVEPLYLTTVKATKSSLLGFLLDGFPVYGPTENGATVTNAMLDAYHGHTAVTADYPGGIYHYHITAADPYINGSGYYGTPGTLSR